MTGSKGSQTCSTLKRGPAVVWHIIGNWGGMLQISHRNVGSAGYLLGTLWDVVALVAPGLVGRANLFRTLVIVRHLGNWQVLARDPDLWRGLMDDFCMFYGRE